MAASRWRPFLLLGLAVAVPGCGQRMRPPSGGWLPDLSAASEQAHGAQVLLRLRGRPRDEAVQGELIVFREDSVFVLTPTGLEAYSRKELSDVGVQQQRPGGKRPSLNWSMEAPALRARARFPAGFAPGIDRSSLLSAPADTLPPAPPDTL